MINRVLIILAPSLLVACAEPGDYPSLAKRPFEKSQTHISAQPIEPPVSSDAALLVRIGDALKQARESVKGFEEEYLIAENASRRASGAAQGSEAWIAGQLAVSRLERTLEPVRDALAALDDERRLIDQRGGSPDRAALEGAIAEVEGIDARQSAAIKRLLGMLS